MSNDSVRLHRLDEVVADLPRKQREIFSHCLHSQPVAEIACRAGLRPRQVERRLARAVYKLCKQMDGESLSWWERLF